jgi:hypothetical protein
MNHMLYGQPYGAGEMSEAEMNYTIRSVAEDMLITTEEASAKSGFIEFSIHGYTGSFNYDFDKVENCFNVTNLKCTEGHFAVSNYELEILAEDIEEKIHSVWYQPLKESLLQARVICDKLNLK